MRSGSSYPSRDRARNASGVYPHERAMASEIIPRSRRDHAPASRSHASKDLSAFKKIQHSEIKNSNAQARYPNQMPGSDWMSPRPVLTYSKQPDLPFEMSEPSNPRTSQPRSRNQQQPRFPQSRTHQSRPPLPGSKRTSAYAPQSETPFRHSSRVVNSQTRQKSVRAPKPKRVRRPFVLPKIKIRKEVVLHILTLLGIFALGYFGIKYNVLALRHVDVRGNERLSAAEVTDLAALSDPGDIWAVSVPRYRVRHALESNPLIESAEVSLASPFTVRIKISERKPLAAIECNSHHIVFDRTGELIEITRPSNLYMGRVVKGMPPGILKIEGTPIGEFSEAWRLPYAPDMASVESKNENVLASQFNKIVNLLSYLSINARDFDSSFDSVALDPNGNVSVHYTDLPPINLGTMDDPDTQTRCLMGILDDKKDFNPLEVSDIDLSISQFPCFHKIDGHLTKVEQKAIIAWKSAAASTETAANVSVNKKVEEKDSVQKSTAGTETNVKKEIFSLSGR
jgi:hypothetical protein